MRQCASCGKRTLAGELIGRYCSRCDHLQGDLVADLQTEFQPKVV